MTLNCIIIDDEPLAANLLKSYVEKTPFLHLVGTHNSAVSAVKDIHSQHVDLVFLDIQMPEINGVEFASLLPRTTKIVFTTAFSQYAIDAYKVNAIGYLLKPISYDSFLAVANKAMELSSADLQHRPIREDKFFYVKSDYKEVQIRFSDILYIEGVKDYVKFVLQKEGETQTREVMSLMNMKHLEEALPKDRFIRVHRSYIVNKHQIKVIDRSRVAFGDVFIPISESYKEELLRFVSEHSVR